MRQEEGAEHAHSPKIWVSPFAQVLRAKQRLCYIGRGSETALRFLIDTVGADCVVFGTDWPADMCIDWPVSWVLSLQSLTQEEKEMILWKNLERLLGV